MLLCTLVRVKLGCYELEGQSAVSPEDYLKAFMEAEVKPLWPKGWMQARYLTLTEQLRAMLTVWVTVQPRRSMGQAYGVIVYVHGCPDTLLSV